MDLEEVRLRQNRRVVVTQRPCIPRPRLADPFSCIACYSEAGAILGGRVLISARFGKAAERFWEGLRSPSGTG